MGGGLSITQNMLLCGLLIMPNCMTFLSFPPTKESPLIHMLQMYELCYDHKNYQGAKDKLLEFQKCLLNVREKKFFSITIFFVFLFNLFSPYIFL